jgi:hypothetical protein
MANEWMSFSDWLGLNQDALDELSRQAAERAQQAEASAQEALYRAYQEALGGALKGGETQLSSTGAYGDYLRLRRQAEEAARPPTAAMSPWEAAARGDWRYSSTMDWGREEGRLQGVVDRWAQHAADQRQEAERLRREAEERRAAEEAARREAEARRRKDMAYRLLQDRIAASGGIGASYVGTPLWEEVYGPTYG